MLGTMYTVNVDGNLNYPCTEPASLPPDVPSFNRLLRSMAVRWFMSESRR